MTPPDTRTGRGPAATETVHLWRVASDTPQWLAEDLSGKGAARSGARWNHPGEHVVYAASSISLAAWETRAHLGHGMALPWNRFLVRLNVPAALWSASPLLDEPWPVGWDALPEGQVSRARGSAWLRSGHSALLRVPSVIVPEECNVLINPRHPDSQGLRAVKLRRFVYDPRI